MAFDFPTSPSVGQLYPASFTPGQSQWRWDGAEWVSNLPSSAVVLATSIKQRVFTTSQTYTPTPGMQYAIVECVAAGGGGGGVTSTDTNHSLSGGGGGGGSYSRSTLTAAQIGASQTVTVGASGAGGGVTGSGGTGGNTSFGSLVTANGGTGGLAATSSTSPACGVGGAAGTGDITIAGGDGGVGLWYNVSAITTFGGFGGGSFFAGIRTMANGAASSQVNGVTGHLYGGGGTGGAAMGLASNSLGGSGASGLCVVTEFGNFSLASVGVVARGAIAGLTLSTPGSSTQMTVAPGQCAESNGGDYITLTAAMMKTTAAWASGSGNGGLDAGTIAAGNWYHWYVVKNPSSGAVDALFSLSATTPNLPGGYTLFRRIGAMGFVSGNVWQGFIQNGDDFLLTATIMNLNNVNPGNTPTLYGMAVPSGISVVALLHVAFAATTVSQALYLWSPLTGFGNPALYTLASPAANVTSACDTEIRTNTAGQIYAQCLTASGNSVYASIYGWRDRRGKDN